MSFNKSTKADASRGHDYEPKPVTLAARVAARTEESA